MVGLTRQEIAAARATQWTADWFTSRHPDEVDSPCCVPKNPRVTKPDASYDVGAGSVEDK